MADEALRPKKTRAQRKAELVMDPLLEERQTLLEKKADEEARYDEIVKLAKGQKTLALLTVDSRLAEIETQLGEYVHRRLRWLLRWFSQTMRRPVGKIIVVYRTVELEMPKSERAVIAKLQKMPGGDAYIRLVPEVDRQALLQAPEPVIAELAPEGVGRSAHVTVSVQSPIETKSKQIGSWRIKQRPQRSASTP